MQQRFNVAVDLIKLNATNYPNSPMASRRLASVMRRSKPLTEKARGPLENGLYRLINQANGNSLQIAGASTNDGALLVTAKYTNGLQQQWCFISQGDGYYQVTNRLTGKSPEVNNWSSINGASVTQGSYHGGPNQAS